MQADSVPRPRALSKVILAENFEFSYQFLGDVECKKVPVKKGFRINKIVCDREATQPYCLNIPRMDCELKPGKHHIVTSYGSGLVKKSDAKVVLIHAAFSAFFVSISKPATFLSRRHGVPHGTRNSDCALLLWLAHLPDVQQLYQQRAWLQLLPHQVTPLTQRYWIESLVS